MAEAAAKPVPVRHVIAVFIGNGLEFYDFLTFSYFAVYIGRAFFPSHNPATSLLASLATFGIGFITRPIGAIVIGSMGDRVARKPAMLLSFSLMGAAIVGLVLTPSYAQIGLAAPALVVLFRLLQGFALGGEVGPTTAYMAESAPPERRGLYLCMQYATQDAAILFAGFVGVVLAKLLNDQQLQEWGWRVAMVIGALVVPFGLYVRARLPETLERAEAPATEPVGIRARVKTHWVIIVLGLLMLTGTTIGSYSIGYMTTYALDTLKLSAAIAFGATIINGGFSIISEVWSGWLSDKFGRKPVMLIPGALLVIAIFPGFWIIEHFRNAWALYGAESVMVFLAGVSTVPTIVTHRISAAGDPLRRGGDDLCVRDFHFRRLDAIHRQMADPAHGRSAGAGVLLDRGDAARADRHGAGAGNCADKARRSAVTRQCLIKIAMFQPTVIVSVHGRIRRESYS